MLYQQAVFVVIESTYTLAVLSFTVTDPVSYVKFLLV